MTPVSPLPVGATHSEILPPAPAHTVQLEAEARDPLARAFSLPCMLTCEIALAHFTVGDLMRLGAGSVLESHTQQNEDLPLLVNGQLVGLVEIEVVGDNLAVRLTGIA